MKRIKEINILRGFAIIGVVLIHVTASFSISEMNSVLTKVNASIDVYNHFSIPLFVLISGIVLGMNYVSSYNIKKFYTKRFNKLFIPYLIWSLFYLPLKMYVTGTSSFKRIGIWFLSAGVYYHLWFFLLILQLYILYPIIRKILNNKKISFLALILIFQIIYNHEIGRMIQNYYSSFIPTKIFFSYIFYFSFGIWISDNIDKVNSFLKKIDIKISVVLFGITIILSVFLSYNWLANYNKFHDMNDSLILFENIITPLMYIVIFINLSKISKLLVLNNGKAYKFMNKLGKYSFGIFLVHAVFLDVTQEILEFAGLYVDNLFYYILSFLITLISSLVFCSFIENTNFSELLIGIRKSDTKKYQDIA